VKLSYSGRRQQIFRAKIHTKIKGVTLYFIFLSNHAEGNR
jgi:hypothetical protein